MDLGSRITKLRKQNGWSQNELSKKIDVSREIIGRYERGDAMPSIDIANRLATTFKISLDYLVGNSDQAIDPNMLKRINAVGKMSTEDQNLVFSFLDAFITKAQLKGIM